MALNLCVHLRLGDRWFVGFIMSATPVANEIDDDISLEGISVVDGELSDENDRLGVICIYVENRCLHHLGNVGAVLGRAGVVRSAGRKSDLIIDHNV